MKKLLLLAICLLPFTAEAGLKAVSSPSAGQAPFRIGTPAYVDTGTQAQYTGDTNSYIQAIIQNINAGSTASADFIVSNNLGTSYGYYGDFGINSSAWLGGSSFSLPNATYLYSQSGDLALGTNTSNAIHFVVNGNAVDSLTITSGGTLAITNNGTTPTISTCGGGTITAGSGTHKGAITGVTAATACTITFASGQTLSAPQTCTIIGSAAIVSPVITSISATAVTFGMTAYTGTLYYHCL